ncbi:MAG: hypothetical protein JEZ01_19855 [Labilibaculum sp.]|nr:hypothetical protein [Labilibaculum sp.]MBI9060031.1 hypothetical protein [Labilibaculum sp.]
MITTLQDIRKSISRFHYYMALTMLFSIGFNVYVHHSNYNGVLGGMLFQFLGSMILGFVVSTFKAKYKQNDWKKMWLGIYVFMVASSILTIILGIFPDN